MRRRLLLIASWLAATAVATFVVWLGVSVVDGEVTGSRPATLSQGTTSSSSTSIGESTTSTLSGGTQETATAATVPATTTTRPPTSVIAPPVPTTSHTETFNGEGGSVTVRFFPDRVELVSATPKPGFSAEVDDNGPERVRVDFTSDGHETRIEATPGGGGSVEENGSGSEGADS